jgi:hypothetical protein
VAAAAAAAARAAGGGTQPAAKRPRVELEQQQQQQHELSSDAKKFTLILKCALGSEVHLTVKPDTQMQKVFQAYADYKSLDLKQSKPLYKGCRISSGSTSTPQELGLMNNEVIDCFLDQVGC